MNASSSLNTAVLFLVFNRPEVTAQVFEAIRKARPPRLYVAADGPRAGREGEAERCAQVRHIATAVDWPCEVKTLFREKNLGCKRAVSGGISWFFEHEEQGIILEDDCLPSQSFFWFCENMLNEFKNDNRVGSISGSLRGFNQLEIEHSIAKSKYFNMWGWATWSRVWNGYDVEFFASKVSFDEYKEYFRNRHVMHYWRSIYEKMRFGRIDTWDYQVIFQFFDKGYLTIYPKVNLVRNLGFGFDATHCFDPNDPKAKIKCSEFAVNYSNLSLDDMPTIDQLLEIEYSKKSMPIRIINKLKRMIRRATS